MGRPKSRRIPLGVFYILAATILWSIVPVCGKFAFKTFDPVTVVFIRLWITAITFVAVALITRKDLRVSRRDLPWLLLGGAGMAGNYLLYMLGLQYTTACATNLVVQIEVVCLIILGWLVLHEPMGRLKVGGILLTFLGVGLVLWNGSSISAVLSSKNTVGNLIVFCAGPSWAFYGLAQKVLSARNVRGTVGLVYIFGTAAVIATIPALFVHEQRAEVTPMVVVSLVSLALLGTVSAYYLLSRAFRDMPASSVAATTSMLPVFTFGTASIFLGERLSPVIVAGAVLVVSGIVVVSKADSISEAQTPEPPSL